MNIRLIADATTPHTTADLVASLLIRSLLGFVFWSGVIAAVRQAWLLAG
ncbi:MAG: hypothetical protein NTZ11_18350 [Gammaproteobacteria bacterium]|nr:hypothetical protein [Gammaproteobacteria bacterium]